MNNSKSVDRQEYSIPSLGPPLSHYAHAVRFGNLLFVSGVLSVDETGAVISPNDVVGQARQIHLLMRKILREVGVSFANVLRVTVYLTDVNDRAKINPVRQEFFGDARPASTLIGVTALAIPDAKVEVDAIVGLPG